MMMLTLFMVQLMEMPMPKDDDEDVYLDVQILCFLCMALWNTGSACPEDKHSLDAPPWGGSGPGISQAEGH